MPGSRFHLCAALLTYALFFCLCLLIAAAGSAVNAHGVADWYPALAKPWFTPPDWILAPVWTVLYAMIAVAGARLALVRAEAKEPVLVLYGVQLALNLAWSWVFFYGQAIGAAVAIVLALLLAIAATISLAWPKDRVASLLLVPYLAWVGFAGLLTIAIWWLN